MPERVAAELVGLAVMELDALRELASIGAGHAATALSRMTGRRVGVCVPSVSVATAAGIRDILQPGREPALLVRLAATGRFAAGFVLAFGERDAHALADLLLGSSARGEPLSPALTESALTETGNVLAGAYLSALSRVTGWSIPLTTPLLVRVGHDDEAALAEHSGAALCLETTFSVDDRAVVRGHVLLLPRHGTLAGLLSAIGLPAAN